jgi:hypothetical protein
MATQFNDIASEKKASAVAVGGMCRWTADLADGRTATPEWHSTQVQQFSKRCPYLENCVKTKDLSRFVSRARNVSHSQNDAAAVYTPGSTNICPVHLIPHHTP